MSNYTWNTIQADKEVIKRLLNNKGKFTFQTFIPCPDEITNTTAGTIVDELVCLYVLENYTYKEVKSNRQLLQGFSAYHIDLSKTKKYNIESLKTSLRGKLVDEVKDGYTADAKVVATLTGKDYFKLHQKYGCHNWYDWHCKYWGTKWDAFDVEISDTEIRFTTAWSMPEPIFDKICEMFPDKEIFFSADYEDNYYVAGKNNDGTFSIVEEHETYDEDELE